MASEARDFFAGLLQDHTRIEEQVKKLELAAQRVSRAEGDAEALGTIAAALRFFATEGARHEEREELALFPRLRPLPAFKQIVSALEFQHGMNDTANRELAAHVEGFRPGGGRELLRLALRFVEMRRGHAIAEERALFPLAASALSPQVVAEMGREVQQRESRVP